MHFSFSLILMDIYGSDTVVSITTTTQAQACLKVRASDDDLVKRQLLWQPIFQSTMLWKIYKKTVTDKIQKNISIN